jgi:GT2 family glycosyltransferase
MAGNLSVKKDRALEIGGFDENFLGVAYRFETDFARRIIQAGGKIRFEPRASIRHLRAATGGTRKHGNHLTSPSPLHGVGDYYFALKQGTDIQALLYILRRLVREVSTRFHLRHPWYIPVKLLGEFLGLMLAVVLRIRGPRLIRAKI